MVRWRVRACAPVGGRQLPGPPPRQVDPAREQHHDDEQHHGVHDPDAEAEGHAVLLHPRLDRVQHVEVDREGEHGDDQVERAPDARVGVGERDREQRHHQRRDRNADAPQDLGLGEGRALGNEVGGRPGPRTALADRPIGPALEADRVALELHRPVFCRARRAFVAPAPFQHEEAVAVRRDFDLALRRHDDAFLALATHADEDVADLAAFEVHRLDEEHAVGATGLDETARRDATDIVAPHEVLSQFLDLRAGPRGDEKRKQRHSDDDRPREAQHRPHPRVKALAGGEPHDHLGVAVGT